LILLDFSQVCLSGILASGNKDFSEDLIRHMVLNSIRGFKSRFSDYGELVICCDDKNYWRKQTFPYYKANRKKNREESSLDWNLIFNTLNTIKEEIKENFPYVVIQVETAEADDIIASMVERYGSSDEKIMIVSGDKDFSQLQRYKNVEQYSPITKKFIRVEDPMAYLYEHVIRGDAGDGVPNILSRDDVFVVGARQRPLTTKKVKTYINEMHRGIVPFDGEIKRNYMRNIQLIDLSRIPDNIRKQVIETYSSYEKKDKSKLLNYFIKNKLKNLMSDIQEF
jgi:5'-3' exonuclease